MEVNSLKTAEVVVNYNQRTSSAEASGVIQNSAPVFGTANLSQNDTVQNQTDSVKLDKLTTEINKFFQMANADLQFSIHEGTQQLIVKVVDLKENKVLKEFPPHEFLDMIASVREYVGMLLDKKA